jgi:4-hydroxybenzoate polyprenyltransferase
MVHGRHTPLDYFFFLRPVLLPPVWSIALLGTVSSDGPHQLSPGLWAIFLAHLTTLFGGVYTLNQVADIETDRRNDKLHFLPDGLISVRAAWIFTVVLDIAALGFSTIFGWRHVMLTIIIILLGIVYSLGSSPWKNHPWPGLFANAVGHGFVVYFFGRVVIGEPLRTAYFPAIAYSLAVGAVYLTTTIPDIKGDRLTGKHTAAVAWGAKTTAIVASVLVLLAIAAAIWMGDRYLAISGMVGWPFFLLTIFRVELAATAAKAAVGALSIAAAVAYPWYLILLVCGFIATRLFFRWRFGISYPSLS